MAFGPNIAALGNAEGDVTIVEFVDYQCAYCKLCYGELKKLMAEDPGIRLVIKDWPIFGDASRHASRMALAAGGSRYAEVVEAFMGNRRGLSVRRIDSILRKAGIDADALRQSLDIRGSEIDLALAQNHDQAMSFGLEGTPALLVGNQLYKRGMPLAELRQVVASVRAAALA